MTSMGVAGWRSVALGIAGGMSDGMLAPKHAVLPRALTRESPQSGLDSRFCSSPESADLDLTIAAGLYASGEIPDGSEGFMPGGLEAWELLCSVIVANGKQTDPRIRDRAAQLYTVIKTSSWMSQRFAQAPEVGAEVSLGKLAATQLMRDWRDLALTALGPHGQLLGGENTIDGLPAQVALSVPGLSIAGGTDEIQRNIVGERVLGLPREPRPNSG